MKRKVYIAAGIGRGYSSPIHDCEIVDNIEDANIVLFTGGADVCPESYGRRNVASYGSKSRDNAEIADYNRMRKDQLAIGICRGAQLLTVLNGGNLVQDCSNHAIWGEHKIINPKTNEILHVTSMHHQMMYPFDIDKDKYSIEYTAEPNLSKYYAGDGIDVNKILQNGEPEVVTFKGDGPMALAIQGHPEMMDPESNFVIRYNEWIDDCLSKTQSKK